MRFTVPRDTSIEIMQWLAEMHGPCVIEFHDVTMDEQPEGAQSNEQTPNDPE